MKPTLVAIIESSVCCYLLNAMKDKMFDIDFDDSESPVKIGIKDDRRMGVDRRLFSYHLHIPERRTGKDRRNVKDRRKFPRLKNKY